MRAACRRLHWKGKVMADLRSKPLHLPLALGAALAIALPRPASAQEFTNLGTIVLSALRTAADRLSTGVSVSVVTEEEIARDNSANLAAVLARLPGVSVTQTGPLGSTAALRVRGLDGRYLAVYVDGIRVSDPSGTTVSFDFGALLSSDISRVEVLRGSQSALWGGSAVGGVINITTRTAMEEGTHQTLSVEGGSYGTGGLSYGLTHKDDRVELAFTATRYHTDGFSASNAGDEADGADVARLSFSTRYAVSETVALGGALFVQKTDQEYDASATVDAAGISQERRELGVRAFAEVEAGNTLHLFDVTVYDLSRRYDQSGTLSKFTGKRLTFGWQGTTVLSDAVTLVYGADWARETAEYPNLPSGKADTTTKGAFAQLIWSPSEAFDLSATLRADHHSEFGSFPTGRLAAAWHPSEATTIHAAVARGYRAPSVDELFGDYPSTWGDFVGNPDLDPEKSLSYELGIEHAAGGSILLSATAFRIEVDNLVSYQFGFPASTLANLPGESVSQGLELAGAFTLNDRLSLGLSYTYTDARRPNGERQARVPLHALSLSLDAEVTDRLSAGLTLDHVANRRDNDPATFSLVKAPDYTVLGARFDYALSDTASAYLRIENLTDEDYETALGYGTSGRAVYVGLSSRF